MEKFYWYIYNKNKPTNWEVCINFKFIGTLERVPDDEFDMFNIKFLGKFSQKEFELYNRLGYFN